jgi:2-hydroxycyclohexanecarboxyl-CoA dehydrogenase
MDLGLKDRVAVVTGGASGIGLATARLFGQEGARIAIWDRDERALSAAHGLVNESGIRARGYVADICNEEAVAHARDSILHDFGRVDHVVHCAAIGSGQFGFPFTNLSPNDWRLTLEVNIMGMTNVAHSFAPDMMEAKRGTFVFVASIAGQIGSQTDPPYSASKAANINFAQCMAKDLAPHGVRVNTVCPGMVKTPLNRAVWQAWHDRATPGERLSYEDWAEAKIKATTPLRRWQTPEDIAAMIVFLSSDRAKEVTGQTINVDGGFVMHS